MCYCPGGKQPGLEPDNMPLPGRRYGSCDCAPWGSRAHVEVQQQGFPCEVEQRLLVDPLGNLSIKQCVLPALAGHSCTGTQEYGRNYQDLRTTLEFY